MLIKCCNGCVPPKRHTACWGSCPEYIEEKANYDAKKAEHDKKASVYSAIYSNRCKQVNKALKKRRK